MTSASTTPDGKTPLALGLVGVLVAGVLPLGLFLVGVSGALLYGLGLAGILIGIGLVVTAWKLHQSALTLMAQHAKETEAACAAKLAAEEAARAGEIARIRQSAETATSGESAKNLFIANMSHEVRTPLNGILGMVDLLMESELTPEQRDIAQVMRISGDDLLVIINDLIDLTKMESGKLEIRPSPVNISSAVRNVVSLVKPVAKSKNLHVDSVIDPSVPTELLIDGVRFRQVLLNLTANAVKFTEHGSVTIQTRFEPSTDGQYGHLFVSVHDTGIGIAPEEQVKLFKPFSQIDSRMTRHYQGSGLGLALSKRLVELMEGAIWVHSEIGQGSIFSFYLMTRLPEQRAVEGVHGASREEPSEMKVEETARVHRKTTSLRMLADMGTRFPMKILLAEDNPINVQVAIRLLRALGYSADVVENGRAVLAALKDNSYDVILLDIQMPEMDGMEVARSIRHTMRDPLHPYLIAVTANAMFGSREECLQVGMNDYVSKPVRGLDMQFALQRAVQALGITTSS
jgi:signal transduction histidine kinase/ActR/RegA family two-component response regulator